MKGDERNFAKVLIDLILEKKTSNYAKRVITFPNLEIV